VKIPTEQKLVSFIGLLLSAAILTITFIEQGQLQRSIREAADVGVIIDVSPDQLQLNIRVGLALGLGALSLWSPRLKNAALVAAALFWGFSYLISLGTSPFDRAEPLIHLFIVACLLIAVVFMRRRWSDVLNAMLFGIFVLFNFLMWALWTQQIKQFSEARELYPPTWLNNLLYGAQSWHVVVLALTLCMLAWDLRLVMTRRAGARAT
jgi:hypothetical protein